MKSRKDRVTIIDRYATIVRAHGSGSEIAVKFRAQYNSHPDLLGRFRQLDRLIDSAEYRLMLARDLPTKHNG